MQNEEWLSLFEQTLKGRVAATANKTPAEIDKLALQVLHNAIKDGFDINFQDGNDYTALAYAAEYNRIDCVNYLLSLDGIDTSLYVGESDDSIEGCALHIAAFKGNLAVIRALVKKSPGDIDLEEGGGYTPLHETVLNEQYPAFKLLLQLGADDEIPTVRTGTSIVPGSLNTFQLITHQAKEDKTNQVFNDMLEYLVLHKKSKGEEFYGNVPDTSDEESEDDSDSYDEREEHLEKIFSHIDDEMVRNAMVSYYLEDEPDVFFEPKPVRDYIPAKEVIQKSERLDLKRSFDEASFEHKAYTEKGEDPLGFDSDSEEELEYQKKPTVKMNSHFPVPPQGAKLVVSARGNHFTKDSVTQAKRKKYVTQSNANTLASWGMYSANTHKHAEIDFSLPNHDSSKRQAALAHADKKTQQSLQQLAQEKNVAPVLQQGSKGSRASYDTRLEEMIQRYVNSYQTFQNDIALAQGRKEEDIRTPRTKEKQACLSTIKGNPFISTSEDIGVGLEYAVALLNYDKKVTHQPASEKMKAITLMPQYRKNGELRHPYLGVIFVTLHTQDEIIKSSASILDLFSRFKIDVKKSSPGSHESSGYVRALERIFFGGIDKNHICIAKVVRLPSLYLEYRPELLMEKYGLTVDQYNKFKQELRTHGAFIPSTKKMRNEQQFFRTQENIIKHVIAHERKNLIQHIQTWASTHQIEVGTLNERGEFVANIDIDIPDKVRKATARYESNKANAVRSTIIEGQQFNVVNMAKDGNCLFHAINHQLRGTQFNYSASALRALAVAQLTQKPQEYEGYMEDNQTISEHIEKISQNRVWAGEVDIRALADRLNIQISVVNQLRTRNNITHYNQNGSLHIYLSYNGRNHYDSFEPANTSNANLPPASNNRLGKVCLKN